MTLETFATRSLIALTAAASVWLFFYQPDSSRSSFTHSGTQTLRPGDPLMAYLVQVWRGVPQCGGLGWVTYGGPVSEARAHQLLALSQRIRPQHPHKLETICPG